MSAESTVIDFPSAASQMGIRSKTGPWGTALLEVAEERADIIAMSADLKKYTDLSGFAERHPSRYVDVGMAEQNLVMTAAGIARSGLTVVATTFAAFLTRRTTDFAMMQIALPKLNVKLIGATPGISSTFGPSHTSIEDLAVWRSIPNFVVIDPADPVEAGEALKAALDHDGPVYLRQPFNRASAERVDDLPPFDLYRAAVLREGSDIGIVVSGDRVHEALVAADALTAEGISTGVLKVSTLKPFDGDAVAALAEKTGRLLTVENHSIIGGLFSATAEALVARGVAATVDPIGVRDVFPPFGSQEFVAERMGMTADHICEAAYRALPAV